MVARDYDLAKGGPMNRIAAPLFFIIALSLFPATAMAEDRFPILDPEKMTPPQKKLLDSILSGPRGGGERTVQRTLTQGPFNTWMYSPELGDKLQAVGAHVR